MITYFAEYTEQIGSECGNGKVESLNNCVIEKNFVEICRK